MAVPPEIAFDRYFQRNFPYVAPVRPEDPDCRRFKGRLNLAVLPPVLQGPLRAIQEAFNEALRHERKNVPEHAEHPPFHLDYVEADEQNAIAFRDEDYSFIALTTPLIFVISDLCLPLSQSRKIREVLGLKVSMEERNELHSVLFEVLTAFVVSHEWAHHVHGHVDAGGAFSPSEFLTGCDGSLKTQVEEVVADGYSACFALTNLVYGSGRQAILRYLGLDSEESSASDQTLFALFVIAVSGYLFIRPSANLNKSDVYGETHPPQAARMMFIMLEAIGWCRQNRPELEAWIESQYPALMEAVAEAALGISAGQVWGDENAFLNSESGRKYIVDLAAGRDEYARLWGEPADRPSTG